MNLPLASSSSPSTGLVLLEEEQAFSQEHPFLKEVTPYLRGTYRACQARVLGNRAVTLQEAYQHVFVAQGGCAWCKDHFENLKNSLELVMKKE